MKRNNASDLHFFAFQYGKTLSDGRRRRPKTAEALIKIIYIQAESENAYEIFRTPIDSKYQSHE